MNNFLVEVPRTTKPRNQGLTMVIDTGVSVSSVVPALESTSSYIDYVKLGWCTPILADTTKEKIELYKSFNIKVCSGGTLFEVCYLKNKMKEFLNYIEEHGFDYVEVSDGTVNISQPEKLKWIETLANKYTVISEYGDKLELELEAPSRWVKGMSREIESGAWKVVAEGRETGNAGLYRASSELRTGLVDEILESIPLEKVIWETPQKSQQVWFINRFGSDVNLGNIAQDDVIGLETLRLGLRSDTVAKFHGEIIA